MNTNNENKEPKVVHIEIPFNNSETHIIILALESLIDNMNQMDTIMKSHGLEANEQAKAASADIIRIATSAKDKIMKESGIKETTKYQPGDEALFVKSFKTSGDA